MSYPRMKISRGDVLYLNVAVSVIKQVCILRYGRDCVYSSTANMFSILMFPTHNDHEVQYSARGDVEEDCTEIIFNSRSCILIFSI